MPGRVARVPHPWRFLYDRVGLLPLHENSPTLHNFVIPTEAERSERSGEPALSEVEGDLVLAYVRTGYCGACPIPCVLARVGFSTLTCSGSPLLEIYLSAKAAPPFLCTETDEMDEEVVALGLGLRSQQRPPDSCRRNPHNPRPEQQHGRRLRN